MSPRELGDVRDDVALEAGVEQGTSIDASNTSCSPSSQARWTPGSTNIDYSKGRALQCIFLSSMLTAFAVRQAKWRYRDHLYKGSGARRSAETPKPTSFRA